MRTLKVRLKKDVRDMANNHYAAGSLHYVMFAPDGVPEVVGARYLPLSRDEWEPALSDGDLDRLLGRERGAPRHRNGDGEDQHDLS